MTTTPAHTICPTCSGNVCSTCGHTLTVTVGALICVPCLSAAFAAYQPTFAPRRTNNDR